MQRREFMTLVGGAAATWPLGARAQQSPKPARLGYFAPAINSNLLEALLAGLRDLGYVEGRNLTIDARYLLGQSKTYDDLAAELVRLGPDVIVVTGTPSALALKRQTTTIPIIMAPTADPLRTSLVASLSRPGGNITGMTMYGSELARKRIEVFREAVAAIRRIAVLQNTTNQLHRLLWEDLQPIGPALGLQFGLVAISDPNELPTAISAMRRDGFDALIPTALKIDLCPLACGD